MTPSSSSSPAAPAEPIVDGVASPSLAPWVAVISVVALLTFGLTRWAGGYRWEPVALQPTDGRQSSPQSLASNPSGTPPRGNYVVIDRTNNRLWVRRGSEVLLSAVCSAGSGRVLDDPASDRTWVFDTPTGEFRVRGVSRNPMWRKPDWAFIEEGETPPVNSAERFENGQLGEYALDLGDGYLIHGTLYERLLGRGVTHGCIRVGRDDLRELVRLAPVGTRVFIF